MYEIKFLYFMSNIIHYQYLQKQKIPNRDIKTANYDFYLDLKLVRTRFVRVDYISTKTYRNQ